MKKKGKNHMKKNTKTSILLLLMLSLFFSASVPVNAMWVKYYYWNGFAYLKSGSDTDPTASICSYEGEKKKLTIPTEIDGRRVSTLHGIGKKNNVQEITIPNGVEIESGAFSRLPSLKKVNLSKDNPDYVVKNNLILTKDEKSLVSTLYFIQYPKIPDSVSIIQNGAFSGSNVKKVVFGKNISYLATAAFYDCKNLSSVTFHKDIHLKEIEYTIFEKCSNLKTITIPDSVEKLHTSMFYGCKNLETIIIGKNTSSDLYFQGTPKLRELYFYREQYEGRALEEQKEFSPAHWYSKATIYSKADSPLVEHANYWGIQTSSIEVSCHGAQKWENFEYIVSGKEGNKRASIVNYTGTDSILTIPETVNNIPVKTVEDLGSPTCVKEIHLPDSVTVKGESLSNCRNLEKINISSTNPHYQIKNKLLLRKNGETIVAVPGSITHPKIPKSVRNIADGAFSGSSIQKITIGKNIRYIGYRAFKNCDQLNSVTFHKKSKIKILRNFVFENCSSLTTLELPDSITEIWHGVFYNCKKLETLKMKENLKYIGLDIVTGCEELQHFSVESPDCKMEYYSGGPGLGNIIGSIRDYYWNKKELIIYGKEDSTLYNVVKSTVEDRKYVKFEILPEK